METRILDLLNAKIQDYIDIAESLEKRDIAIVVNNAGRGQFAPFVEEKIDEL